MDWFLYDNGLRHERVNSSLGILKTYFYDFLAKKPPTKLHPKAKGTRKFANF